MSKQYLYTENRKGKIIALEVQNQEDLDGYAEYLLSENSIDCYCFFKGGAKLNKKDFKKLKKIGVSAFIGIVSRFDDNVLLDDFGATEKEIKISKHLYSLQ